MPADTDSYTKRFDLNPWITAAAPVAAIVAFTLIAAYRSGGDRIVIAAALMSAIALTGGVLAFIRYYRTRRPKLDTASGLSWWIPFALITGLIFIFGYWFNRPGVDLIGVLFTAGGAGAVGVFIGFLFGIPKLASRRGPTLPDPNAPVTPLGVAEGRRLNPNTNLEEISDWLTKIIVGITLFEAGDIVERFNTMTAHTASLGIPKAGAGAVVIYFSVAGFLAGYLWTRLVLTKQFAAGDREADDAALSERLREGLRIDPDTDLGVVFATVRRLTDLTEIQSAVNIGRDFLLWGTPQIANRIFLFLKQNAPDDHPDYYAVLSNLGYSYINEQRYFEAIPELHAAIDRTGLEGARPWHTVALAFAYFETDQRLKFFHWMGVSRRLPEFENARGGLARRYSSIAVYLLATDAEFDAFARDEGKPDSAMT